MIDLSEPVLPRSAAELVPGTLYALGGSIPLDPPPRWMPPGSSGWTPMQCYVFRDADSLAVIDTATAVQREEVRAGLRALVGDTKNRRFLLTRREPDCTMNLPQLVREFGISWISCSGDLNPLDFFDSMDDANAQAIVRAQSDARFTFIRTGDEVPVGKFRFRVLKAPVRVLSSSWFYEVETGSLFSSDFWGFLSCKEPCSPGRADPREEDISPERIRLFTGAKFDWLRGANTRPLIDELASLLDQNRVKRICPTYGLVIEGEHLIEQVVANTFKALEELGREDRPSVMSGFSEKFARIPS